MTRRLLHLLLVLVALAVIAPRAWGQFLSEEERRGMFTVSLGYTTRDYEMDFRSASPPIEDLDAILEAFSAKEQVDSIELTVAWVSFGYVELRATAGMADYDLTTTHSTDAAYNTAWSTSGNLVYGLSAVVRYPLTDTWLIGGELTFMMGKFDDIDGAVSQLDVVPGLTTALDTIDWREVTITPMVMYRTGAFLPYAGVRFSDVTTEVNTILTAAGSSETLDRVVEFENHDSLGAVVGLTWRISPLIMADVHAQLINNESVSLAVKLTF
jgi:hypothetical protein